jgi:uncharacterized iron-regulated membrane protein
MRRAGSQGRSLPTHAYDLQIRQAGAPMNRFPRTHLYIDQYSGNVLAVYDPKADGWGDTVLNWLVPLHDGKAFGMMGRIIVFVLGLLPSVMFVTGFMRWNQKHRARKRSLMLHSRPASERSVTGKLTVPAFRWRDRPAGVVAVEQPLQDR